LLFAFFHLNFRFVLFCFSFYFTVIYYYSSSPPVIYNTDTRPKNRRTEERDGGKERVEDPLFPPIAPQSLPKYFQGSRRLLVVSRQSLVVSPCLKIILKYYINLFDATTKSLLLSHLSSLISILRYLFSDFSVLPQTSFMPFVSFASAHGVREGVLFTHHRNLILRLAVML